MTAADYFKRAREAAVSLKNMEAAIEYARAAEQPAGVSYGEPATRRDDGDNRGATVTRIVLEGSFGPRFEECEGVIEDALAVLYGRDGEEGLAQVHGCKYADAICMRYLQLATCRECAAAIGYTPDYITRLCAKGFALVDEMWAGGHDASSAASPGARRP